MCLGVRRTKRRIPSTYPLGTTHRDFGSAMHTALDGHLSLQAATARASPALGEGDAAASVARVRVKTRLRDIILSK